MIAFLPLPLHVCARQITRQEAMNIYSFKGDIASGVMSGAPTTPVLGWAWFREQSKSCAGSLEPCVESPRPRIIIWTLGRLTGLLQGAHLE